MSETIRAIKCVRLHRTPLSVPPLSLPFLVVICCCATIATPTVALQMEAKYPCAFIDTVNVTGSYAYEQQNAIEANTNSHTDINIISNNNSNNNNNSSSTNNNSTNIAMNTSRPLGDWIPRELVAVYDFVIKNGVRVPVERHLRACVCKLKPCIRFCCEQGLYYDLQSRTCQAIVANTNNNTTNTTTSTTIANSTPAISNITDVKYPDQHEVAIRLSNGTTQTVTTAEHFSVHIDTPCERMRLITKDNRLVRWTLYENGTIVHRNHVFSKHYCYTPMQVEDSTWEWQPLACAPEKLPFVLGTKEWTYAICLIISVICFVIIVFVYLFCTELRNTFYGVAIKAYSLCIVIGYSLMAHLTLTDPANISKLACENIPCYVVLYLLLSFYILSFISFNFYMNFHGIILSKLMFWLIFFPIVLLAVGWSIFVGHANYDGKPIFGGDTCWFDPRNWSIMIYYYAPIFVALAICIFFYILTLIHISERGQFDLNKSNETIEENRFRSFWKFFGYIACVWLVCVTSFAISYYRKEKTHINYAVCLFVAFHGFGALYALIGKNQQVQNFLRRIDEDVDDYDEVESAVPMSSF